MQNIQICLADYVMCLIHKDKLVPRWVELLQPMTRRDALYRRNCDVGRTRSLMVAHFNVDALIWVGESAMTGCLFDELAAMGEYECLRCIAYGGNAVDEMGKDDRLTGAGGQRHTQALVAGI